MYTIRSIEDNDADALSQLMLDFDNPYRSAEDQLKLLRVAIFDHTFVAQIENKLVGFVCVRMVPMTSQPTPYAEVSDLFVQPAYRKQGIGRALMAAAREWAVTKDAHGMMLVTGYKNYPAQALYESMGFKNWAMAMKWDF
jgi:GNAT superfamily N-acetyltransferase